MNLSYSITEKGYKIFNDGVLWITQENYFPYPGDSMEEKANNHMYALSGVLTPYEEMFNEKQKVNMCYQVLGSNYVAESYSAQEDLSENAGYFTDLYREWKPGESYNQWELIQYDGITIQVRQQVTALEHQPPLSEGMTAIYIPYLVPDENGVKTYKYGCSCKKGELFYDENKVIFEYVAVDNPSNIYAPSDDLPALWKRWESEK